MTVGEPTDRVRIVDDPSFVRFAATGRVHILGGFIAIEGSGIVGGLMRRESALCGKTGEPGVQNGVACFHDDDLCQTCRRLFPEERSDELFTHPQPESDTDS